MQSISLQPTGGEPSITAPALCPATRHPSGTVRGSQVLTSAPAASDHSEGKAHSFTKGVLQWWATNGSKFPAWADAAQIVFAFTPNSAAAERVFSQLKAMFGDQQMQTLADIIQTALMLRINNRKVG